MTGRLIVLAALVGVVVVEIRATVYANRLYARLGGAGYALGYVDGLRRRESYLTRGEVTPALRLVPGVKP